MTIETTGTKVPSWIPSDTDFGSRLALVRHRMGWNIKEAARECGVAAATWRLWEVDGARPRSLITIALTIATRTGCDYLWLVHGPDRGGAVRTTSYGTGERLIGAIGKPGTTSTRPGTRPTDRGRSHTRPVRQTRPVAGVSTRPRTPLTV
jgi:hypothetical protein